MQETFEDFIGKFENSLSNETCNNIVKWFDSCSDKISKRFCQSREDAQRLAKSLNDQGYHATIKTDGYL